jgi:putative urate catabolism protein
MPSPKRRKPADYPRDLVGYGRNPPHARWPNDARIALSFVVNYEEGGERSVLHGDRESETYLQEVVGLLPRNGKRDESTESVYEYGSRAGFWRILREFERRRLPFTSWAVGMALARHPEAGRAMAEGGHEVASHGWRWFDYQNMPIAEERRHFRMAIDAIEKSAGARPVGWYTGRFSPNTRKLAAEFGMLYSSDAYNDDLPYWTKVEKKPHLIIPYTLDVNDMKFGTAQGFNTGDDWFVYARDAFDVLYAEGAETPKMMSVGLHLRLIGRPGRFRALQRFLDHVEKHDKVWVARRVDIARHWIKTHPPGG